MSLFRNHHFRDQKDDLGIKKHTQCMLHLANFAESASNQHLEQLISVPPQEQTADYPLLQGLSKPAPLGSNFHYF